MPTSRGIRFISAIGAAIAVLALSQPVSRVAADACSAESDSPLVPGAGREVIGAHGPDLVVRDISVEVLNRYRVGGAQPVVIWTVVENIGDEIADPIIVHFRYREFDSRAPTEGEWTSLKYIVDGAGLVPDESRKYPLPINLAYHPRTGERYSQVLEASVDLDDQVEERCGGESNNTYEETFHLRGPSAPTLRGE